MAAAMTLDSDTTQEDRRDAYEDRPLGQRILFAVPVIGWLIRDAVENGTSGRRWFAFNCVALYGAAVAVIGYPVVIATALIAVAAMFVILILMTAGQ